jgi:hypothetical protein
MHVYDCLPKAWQDDRLRAAVRNRLAAGHGGQLAPESPHLALPAGHGRSKPCPYARIT